MESQLSAWNIQKEKLKKKLNQAPEEKKSGIQRILEDLNLKEKSLKEKIEEARAESEEQWDSTKAKIEENWNTLQKSLADTMERLD